MVRVVSLELAVMGRSSFLSCGLQVVEVSFTSQLSQLQRMQMRRT